MSKVESSFEVISWNKDRLSVLEEKSNRSSEVIRGRGQQWERERKGRGGDKCSLIEAPSFEPFSKSVMIAEMEDGERGGRKSRESSREPRWEILDLLFPTTTSFTCTSLSLSLFP